MAGGGLDGAAMIEPRGVDETTTGVAADAEVATGGGETDEEAATVDTDTMDPFMPGPCCVVVVPFVRP